MLLYPQSMQHKKIDHFQGHLWFQIQAFIGAIFLYIVIMCLLIIPYAKEQITTVIIDPSFVPKPVLFMGKNKRGAIAKRNVVSASVAASSQTITDKKVDVKKNNQKVEKKQKKLVAPEFSKEKYKPVQASLESKHKQELLKKDVKKIEEKKKLIPGKKVDPVVEKKIEKKELSKKIEPSVATKKYQRSKKRKI